MLEKKALALDPSVPTIAALILMDNEGKRIAVDYFGEKLCVDFRRSRCNDILLLLYFRSFVCLLVCCVYHRLTAAPAVVRSLSRFAGCRMCRSSRI
jgi:hypothetical protein